MSQNKSEHIYTEQAIEDDENIWFAGSEGNIFLRLDKATGTVFKVCDLPAENMLVERSYRALCKVGNYFIIAPWMGKSVIAIYDCKTKRMISIRLKNLRNVDDRGGHTVKFSKCIPYKNTVYLTGIRYPAIVRLNLHTFEVEYITRWVEELDKITQNSQERYLAEGEVIGTAAYLPVICKNAILKLNLDTGQACLSLLKTALKGFNGATLYKGKLWMVGRHQGLLMALDLQTNEIEERYIVEDGEDENIALFDKPVIIGERLFLSPIGAQHAYFVSMKNKDATLCMDLEPYIRASKEKCGKKASCVFITLHNNENIYFSLLGDRCQYKYNFLIGEVSKLNLNHKERIEAIIRLHKRKDFTRETTDFPIQTFANAILGADENNNYAEKIENGRIGKRIYEKILNMRK